MAQADANLEHKVEERTAELKTANDSLSDLSARLLQAGDEVNRRTARELHDSVGQLIVAIKINNTTVSREAGVLSALALEALEQNEAMLVELHQSVRALSHLLHPPLLDEAGLPVALQCLGDEFGKRCGIRVTVEVPETLDRASRDLETGVFRIAQECLGDVQKHSESDTATVRFDVHEGRAHLEVCDQGKGISNEEQLQIQSYGSTGLGLRGVRERVAQLGGELQIESSDKGTVITADLPWQPKARAAAV